MKQASLLRPDTTIRSRSKKKMSFGVFLYSPETDTFLVMQNRDSQAFLFFFMIRDIEAWSVPRIRDLLEQCTHDEIQRLLYFPFHEIYHDLYLKHDPVKYQRQERQAFTNYRYFHSRKDLQAVARMIRGQPIPWEFPKGRHEPGEQPLETALRELKEETGIELELDLGGKIGKNVLSFAMMKFEKPKPFLRHSVLVQLYGISVYPKSVEERDRMIQYQDFDGAIRSRSVSDECLHARWVTMDEAEILLPLYLFHTLLRWKQSETRPLLSARVIQ